MRKWSARWAAVAAVVVVASTLDASAPALAQGRAISDAAGDTWRSGLDITRVHVGNHRRAVVTSVRFAYDVRGRVIVSVRARDGSAMRLVHLHRPGRHDRTFVVGGSLYRTAASPCPRASGAWHRARTSVTLRLPARCLDSGGYGAVRAGVLTERSRGGDVDAAPQTRDRRPTPTGWLPRH